MIAVLLSSVQTSSQGVVSSCLIVPELEELSTSPTSGHLSISALQSGVCTPDFGESEPVFDVRGGKRDPKVNYI